MKRYSLIICLFLIVSLTGVADAQIVMGPPASGGVAQVRVSYGGSPVTTYYFIYPNPYIGGVSYTTMGYNIYGVAHGVFEFNLGAATFPTTITANNFTARLDGLTVTDAFTTTAPTTMNIDLFDMGDTAEDGVITLDDFDNTRGSRIAWRTHNFLGAPADFNDINVTAAVRNDLFGAGQTDYSGFILKPTNFSAQLKWILYNATTPTLTISPSVTDLAVGKTVNDTTPDVGQTITYTITLTNNGPDQATTVSITDLLPAGVTYNSDDSGGSYNSGTGVWSVGTINNSASAILNIQVTVDAGTSGLTITNSVTAASLDQTDSNATPDDLSEDITVNNGDSGGGGGCFIVTSAR